MTGQAEPLPSAPGDDGNPTSTSKTGVAVLDKIAALEVTRKAEREKRREESRDAADPMESVKAFLTQCALTQQAIESQLSELLLQGPQEEAGPNRAAVQSGLDGAAAAALALEGRCASAAYFLPSFEQKQCAAAIADVRARIAAAAAELLPVRKFSFSRKVARVKAGGAPADPSLTAPPPAAASSTGAPPTSAPADDGAALRPVLGAAIVVVPSERDIAQAQAGRGLMGLRGATVVITADQLGGKDFVLLDLQGCTVYLLGHLAALRVLGMRDCRVYCGPVTGACFLDDVQGSTLVLASYQVRIHRTLSTDFCLRVRSKPIIEHSHGVRFAPYALCDPAVTALMGAHKLGEETGMYREVDDFGWIKASHSPHWSLVPEGEQLQGVLVPAELLVVAVAATAGVDEL